MGVLASSESPGAGLFLPSLNVHADEKKLEGQRSFPDEVRDQNVREKQTASERRPQEDQLAQARQRGQEVRLGHT